MSTWQSVFFCRRRVPRTSIAAWYNSQRCCWWSCRPGADVIGGSSGLLFLYSCQGGTTGGLQGSSTLDSTVLPLACLNQPINVCNARVGGLCRWWFNKRLLCSDEGQRSGVICPVCPDRCQLLLSAAINVQRPPGVKYHLILSLTTSITTCRKANRPRSEA